MSIKWHIEVHERAISTQNLLKERAIAAQPEGTVVQALIQSNGYGRAARQWVSPPGNLYLSILLKPSCHVQHVGQLSLMAGVAVGRTVERYISGGAGNTLRLKWPNDVLIDGDKCAGLILETSIASSGALEWVALGIGINVEKTPALSGLNTSGTSIAEHSKATPSLDKIRDVLLRELSGLYQPWQQEQNFAAIKAAWLEMAHKKGDMLSVKMAKGLQQGTFYDVDEFGSLLFHDEVGALQKINSGDIYV